MGSTDIAAAFVLGEVWLKVPASIKIVYSGTPGPMVFAKDIMLRTVGELGIDGATYRAIEYHGSTVDELSITGRITMANMAIEAGAKNGIFHADAKTIAYVEGAYRPAVRRRASRRRRRLRAHDLDRHRVARAAGRLSAHARQRPSDLRSRARRLAGRSGLHRFVHQRLHRRPAHRREDPRRKTHRVATCASSSTPVRRRYGCRRRKRAS